MDVRSCDVLSHVAGIAGDGRLPSTLRSARSDPGDGADFLDTRATSRAPHTPRHGRCSCDAELEQRRAGSYGCLRRWHHCAGPAYLSKHASAWSRCSRDCCVREVAPQNETVFAVRISGALRVRLSPRGTAIRSTRHQACAGQANCAAVVC